MWNGLPKRAMHSLLVTRRRLTYLQWMHAKKSCELTIHSRCNGKALALLTQILPYNGDTCDLYFVHSGCDYFGVSPWSFCLILDAVRMFSPLSRAQHERAREREREREKCRRKNTGMSTRVHFVLTQPFEKWSVRTRMPSIMEQVKCLKFSSESHFSCFMYLFLLLFAAISMTRKSKLNEFCKWIKQQQRKPPSKSVIIDVIERHIQQRKLLICWVPCINNGEDWRRDKVQARNAQLNYRRKTSIVYRHEKKSITTLTVDRLITRYPTNMPKKPIFCVACWVSVSFEYALPL